MQLMTRECTISDVVKQTVRAIRGLRSQGFISKRLKTSRTTVTRWESGAVRITWDEFVKLCDVCKIRLHYALSKTLGGVDPPSLVAELLYTMAGDRTVTAVASCFDVSRTTAAAWLSERTSPPTERIFYALDIRSELASFVANIVSIDQVPAIAPVYHAHAELRNFLAAHPECLTLLPYLQLTDGHLNAGQAETQLGIQPPKQTEFLKLAVKVGLVKKTQGRHVVLVPQLNTGGHTPEDFDRSLAIKRYWAERALEFMTPEKVRATKSRFTYKSFAVSKETATKIWKISGQAYADICKAVDDDEGAKTVLSVINIHILSLIGTGRPDHIMTSNPQRNERKSSRRS